jgi:predicted ATPase
MVLHSPAQVVQQRATGALVFGDEEERVYTFKHSMVQQVTYSMILFQERRQLHAQITEFFNTRQKALSQTGL